MLSSNFLIYDWITICFLSDMNNKQRVEIHPIPPFLPQHAKLLMLGSFPPPQSKWRMDFFYPNFQNDMWRIFGYIFFADKDYFIDVTKKKFNEKLLRDFLAEKGVAVSDTAYEVIRTKNNASDNFLEIVTPMDIETILFEVPLCETIITTGKKATEILQSLLPELDAPEIGAYTDFLYENRSLRLYRLPSSSRAYPLPLGEKAKAYATCFSEIGIL